MELLAEIGILCGCNPRLCPLGPDAHLAHVLANGAFGDFGSVLTQFDSDLRGTVVLLGFVVDLPDVLLHGFPAKLCGRGLVLEEGTVS